jgi:thiol-disulfide isomerase/thioredoxin
VREEARVRFGVEHGPHRRLHPFGYASAATWGWCVRTAGLLTALLLLTACQEPVPYEVLLLPEPMMAKRLQNACGRASEAGKPLLVEFSASWCPGCNALLQKEHREPLTLELAQWERVNVNVGQFDHHTGLMEAYGVKSIPHWTVVYGADCSKPAYEWEPARSRGAPSGNTRSVTEHLEHIRRSLLAGEPLPT